MLQAFVITLREGLEAFLIVAISIAYLKKTGRESLVPAVNWGIAGSIVLSILAGLLFARAANQALWEGILALVAGVLVASLTVHMWRAGKRMKKAIETRLEASSSRLGTGAFLGVLGFTLLMITREGMETALLMNTLLFSVGAPDIIGGAIAGEDVVDVRSGVVVPRRHALLQREAIACRVGRAAAAEEEPHRAAAVEFEPAEVEPAVVEEAESLHDRVRGLGRHRSHVVGATARAARAT